VITMIDTSTIPAGLAAINKRAEKLVKYPATHLICSAHGWSVHLSDLKLALHDFPDAQSALDAIDDALAKIEDRDGALARTLGIAA
jgi:hypothetical protein